MTMQRPIWIAAYSRKSRHLDKEISEKDLFDKHRALLVRLADEVGLDLPGDRIFFEVGSSESLADRPVCTALLNEVDALPLKAGGHLLIPDPDRLTRGNQLEQALIYNRLQRAGVHLHQVIGGECDLDDYMDATMLQLKAIFSRLMILQYKAKVAGTNEIKLQRGEPRNGAACFGYWNDKSEKLARDRFKPDHRSRDHTGLTAFEKLVRICEEVHTTSVAKLAVRYNVSRDTLLSTLKTPTIAGYPVVRMKMREDPHDTITPRISKRRRVDLAESDPASRDNWIWPKQAGDYPAACSLDEWWAIQEVIEKRRSGRVKTGQGNGVCLHVVRFVGSEGRVILSSINGTRGPEGRHYTPSYRQHSNRYEVPRDVVDSAASDWLRDLMQRDEGHFFAWMIAEYYQQRRDDPLPRDEELSRLDQQLRRWRQEVATVTNWAASAETDTECEAWRTQVKRLAGLIEETERQREVVRNRRSPIAQVDRLIPRLTALTRRWGPTVWGRYWPEIWEALDLTTRRDLVEAFIAEIWVRCEQAAPRARVQRSIDRIVPAPFVAQAQEQYPRLLGASASTCQQSVGLLWERIEQLAA